MWCGMRFGWIVFLALAACAWLALRSTAMEMWQEEIRTRLSLLPNALTRLATLRLPEEIREDFADEWQAELAFVLRDTDGLPLTRLFRGTRYAMGLVRSAGGIARELSGIDEAGACRDTALADVTQEISDLAELAGYRGPTACAAAGITYRQLDYWARTGLVAPSLRAEQESGTQRLYSFRDIIALKVIKRLLDCGISLGEIRAAVADLLIRDVNDLARLTLVSDGHSVYEVTSTDEVVDLLADGQGVFGIALGRVWEEVDRVLAAFPGWAEAAVSPQE
jgi:DNA-binding transcriptional MerR regulator